MHSQGVFPVRILFLFYLNLTSDGCQVTPGGCNMTPCQDLPYCISMLSTCSQHHTLSPSSLAPL